MLHRLGYIEKNPQDMLLKLSENLRQIPTSFWKKKKKQPETTMNRTELNKMNKSC